DDVQLENIKNNISKQQKRKTTFFLLFVVLIGELKGYFVISCFLSADEDGTRMLEFHFT
uniref:Uncharacterized protein n=1 Tax=Oryzias sinensis TaxID=183150 RepID=A0A8C8DT96_9TELE